jgi:hypothetical protein
MDGGRSDIVEHLTTAGDMSAGALYPHAAALRAAYELAWGAFRAERPRCPSTMSLEGPFPRSRGFTLDVGA